MWLLKSLCISFSIYSKIPVPIFEWKEKEMKYQLIFFPWIGAVIGALIILWDYICGVFGIGTLPFILICAAIPLLVTGGFHVDGYMDTMDALRSYKTKEEKLEILKDPHIGAFAVIMLAAAGMIFLASLSLFDRENIPVFACAFFSARALSAIAVVSFPAAKKDGMLYTFSNTAAKKVFIWILIQFIVCCAFMICLNTVTGITCICVSLAVFAYYRYKSIKEFGGITGDTAGAFVMVCEIACAAAVAVCSVII